MNQGNHNKYSWLKKSEKSTNKGKFIPTFKPKSCEGTIDSCTQKFRQTNEQSDVNQKDQTYKSGESRTKGRLTTDLLSNPNENFKKGKAEGSQNIDITVELRHPQKNISDVYLTCTEISERCRISIEGKRNLICVEGHAVHK